MKRVGFARFAGLAGAARFGRAHGAQWRCGQGRRGQGRRGEPGLLVEDYQLAVGLGQALDAAGDVDEGGVVVGQGTRGVELGAERHQARAGRLGVGHRTAQLGEGTPSGPGGETGETDELAVEGHGVGPEVDGGARQRWWLGPAGPKAPGTVIVGDQGGGASHAREAPVQAGGVSGIGQPGEGRVGGHRRVDAMVTMQPMPSEQDDRARGYHHHACGGEQEEQEPPHRGERTEEAAR